MAYRHLIIPQNAEEICEQPLWHNTHIKIGGKCIEYTRWKNKGINTIQDIINGKGEILDKKKLNAKYDNVCKHLEYESLVSAIKSKWKQKLREKGSINTNFIITEGCYITINNAKIKLEQIKTRDLYWHLIKIISKRPTSESKWNENINFEIDETMWKIIYTNSKHVTNDSNILNFQYKITHRLLHAIITSRYGKLR
jgi:hypothetical protein